MNRNKRRAMKGLVLIPNLVKRRWHQHILHVHYARRLRLQLLDVLAPGIGEIIGDSQREERLDVLDARMTGARRRRSTTPGTGICAATARCRTRASASASSARLLRHGPCERARRDPVPEDAGECEVLRCTRSLDS